MMRKPFIAANWKMNKLVEESVEYGETLVEKLKAEKVDPEESRRGRLRSVYSHGRSEGHICTAQYQCRGSEYAL